MKIIKLNAIDSTNSFLKKMASNSAIENFTIVVTDKQLKGRGQQGAEWVSDAFTNLMFSVFTSFGDLHIADVKYLNYAVSLAVFDALTQENIPNISIKWPNDIVSANKKICGVLIENSLKGGQISSSVIGIGLNVNQTSFVKSLKKASSLKLITKRDFDLDKLMLLIISKLKSRVEMLNSKDFRTLESDYLKVLYKKNTPTMFKDSKGVLFMGIVRGVSKEGNLQVELEDETLNNYGLKEITFL